MLSSSVLLELQCLLELLELQVQEAQLSPRDRAMRRVN